MNVEFTHRGVRIAIGPDHKGERMWRVFPEGGVILTDIVQRAGLEDTLKRTIVEAQEAIPENGGGPGLRLRKSEA